MKPAAPCPQVPTSLLLEAEAAEQRKDRALARLREKLGASDGDEFDRALRALIDADKAALEARGR